MTAFISDIHGNFPALLAVFEALDAVGVNKVFSLGDIAGYYPMINQCIGLIRERSVQSILGNHDHYLLNHVLSNRSASVNRAIEYQRGVISKDNLLWLAKLPIFLKESEFFAVHGGTADKLEEYTVSPVFTGADGPPLFLCGHTHKQQYAKKNEKSFCNPGSVGQPRDGDPGAAYALLRDDGRVELCRAEYDVDLIAYETKRAGFDKRFYE
ncbi:MAG: metallophosphatase family protein, partial [Oscillospiraceae bacterium]|nr:metallophosphatase family protein [Oscillospiraceae bacterium]